MNNKSRLEVYKKTQGCCWYCGEHMDIEENWLITTHNDPPENILICASCLKLRGKRSDAEFMQYVYENVFDGLRVFWNVFEKWQHVFPDDIRSPVMDHRSYIYIILSHCIDKKVYETSQFMGEDEFIDWSQEVPNG